MALCLDFLVASLPLISYNAIADMDDVRYMAYMATLIVAQSSTECQLAADLQRPALALKI